MYFLVSLLIVFGSELHNLRYGRVKNSFDTLHSYKKRVHGCVEHDVANEIPLIEEQKQLK